MDIKLNKIDRIYDDGEVTGGIVFWQELLEDGTLSPQVTQTTIITDFPELLLFDPYIRGIDIVPLIEAAQ
jgi:hypothetical protein